MRGWRDPLDQTHIRVGENHVLVECVVGAGMLTCGVKAEGRPTGGRVRNKAPALHDAGADLVVFVLFSQFSEQMQNIRDRLEKRK